MSSGLWSKQGWICTIFVCAKSLSCVRLSVLWPHGLESVSLLCPWDSPGKNTGVGCQALLQRILTTPGSNPRLLSLAVAGGFLATSAPWEAAQSPTKASPAGTRLGLRVSAIFSGRTQGQKLKKEEHGGEVRVCRGYEMSQVLARQGSGGTGLGLMGRTGPEAFLSFLLQLLLPDHQVSVRPFNCAFFLFFFSLFFSSHFTLLLGVATGRDCL